MASTMTGPRLLERFKGTLGRAMRQPQRTGSYDGNGVRKEQGADAIEKQLAELGIYAVSRNSDDETIAEWERKLWEEQDWLLEDREKEWRQHIYYVSNEQFIAYHRDRRTWIPRRTQPWRIRSNYNITSKAVNLRVSRLTEKKPTLSVQAKKPDRQSMDKAEYKEMVFWHIWNVTAGHKKITRSRRWATITGSGFLVVGWDPDAGPPIPATQKVPRVEVQPVLDPTTQQPVIGPDGQPQTQQVTTGVDEFYIDEQKQQLGPVERIEPDPDEPDNPNATRLVRVSPPEGTAYYHEGEVEVLVDNPFNIRWDRYTDELHDSWYIQRQRLRSASQILALDPRYAEKLKLATPAKERDLENQWEGVTSRGGQADLGGPMQHRDRQGPGTDQPNKLDTAYVVRETWIWPKNDFLRKQWGKNGAIITTIGGEFCHLRDLPPWALDACNFIHLGDEEEPGNHYTKSLLRDLLPLQDDINRTRSHKAERVAILSRVLLGAVKGHGMNIKMLGGMPGVLVEYRSPEYKPEGLDLASSDGGAADTFYQETLDAAADVGHMQDATIGKLPSAGLAAKAIYALQYADERSIIDVSNQQDVALQQLATAIDAVTRHEYTEKRKIRIPGDDFAFLAEAEIVPEDLDVEVDYQFQPGSMLSRNKEAVKNEIEQLREMGLIDDLTAKKAFSSAVPEVFRQSYDMQVASARRKVMAITRRRPDALTPPAPWENPDIHVAVIEETLISARFKEFPKEVQDDLGQLWQLYQVVRQQRAAEVQRAQQPPAPTGGAGGGVAGPPGQPSGPDQLAKTATAEMQPPGPDGGGPPGAPA